VGGGGVGPEGITKLGDIKAIAGKPRNVTDVFFRRFLENTEENASDLG